jgi:predicted GIY-YIG superfamily endonuclease
LKSLICTAFDETCHGFSVDRVVTDPLLNGEFIRTCRGLGVAATPVEINLFLLNLRKRGLIKREKRSIKTSFPDEESYRFASEIAARFIEKRDATTLDRIICDPVLAIEFDALAAEIAPGYSPLQYRWAALNLRKSRALRPELLSHVVRPTGISVGAVQHVVVREISTKQGLYIFYGQKETLYVGEAINLQKRIAKHLDHSDNKNLARWFWVNGFRDVYLEVQVLAENTSTKIRKALEAELISTRHPVFNIQRLLLSHLGAATTFYREYGAKAARIASRLRRMPALRLWRCRTPIRAV